MGILKLSNSMGLARIGGFSVGILGVGLALLLTGCSAAEEIQSIDPVVEPEVGVGLQATTNTPPVTPTVCEGLVQAVAATASSVENNSSTYAASKAIDSSMTSRWSSQFSDPQWLKIDLGSIRAIKKVVLTWQNSYSTDYDLQVSNTGADGTWTTVYTDSAGNGGTDEVNNLTASGRYLRMFSRKRKTQYGNSLYDVKVYENTCPCQGKIQPVSATVSSVETGTSLVASKAIDGNFSTRWSSQFSDPQWISMDFGATKEFKRVVLHWETAASAKYDLQVSANGTTWTNVYTNNSGQAGTWDIPNLTASGRYLRVYSRARTTSWGVSLYEIETFQNSCANPCANVVIDDNNVCTTDSCNSTTGVVSHTPVAAGTACADGNLCNGNETCNATGTCTAGTAPVVNDGNPCTADSCGATTGVVHTPVATGTACADGNLCNGNETCNATGSCTAGTAPVVNDGNPCTADSCTAATGVAHTPVSAGTACADGNLCNGSEICNAVGSCLAGTPLNVNDGNPCTTDSCDPLQGVLHPPTPVGTSCGDSNVCNGVETCNGLGSCTQTSPPVVDDGNVCTNDNCDPTLGVIHTLAPNGTPCSDDTVCNGDEACFVGSCVTSTPPPELDDANPCTADECDPLTGAVHTPAAPGSSCDDGDVCNGVATCDEFAVCGLSPAPIVDDSNPCTADACDPSSGVSHTALPVGTTCADDTVCNGDETCDGFGACSAGTALVVDDGNVCTDDHCDATSGVSHTSVPNGTSCSDNTVCNGDEACFSGSCATSSPAPALDDFDPCTDDECDPLSGAVHTPAAPGTNCEDGDVCNGIGACDEFAVCIVSPAPDVDDFNSCTADVCDPITGVAHTLLAAGTTCGEANACSDAGTCDSVGHCIAGAVLPMDDGNPCTADACDPGTGVSHTAVAAGTPCADSNVCNGSETCDGAGACVAGTPLPVDDANPCTADSCSPDTGVVSHAPVAVGTSCADSNQCNGTETCDIAGACVAGTPPTVNDNNPCTLDSCNPATGVIHTPTSSGSACGDADLCNGQEACNGAGLCVTFVPGPVINDGNPCTNDVCVPSTGVVNHPRLPTGSSCSDGNVCNGAETCSSTAVCRIVFPGGAPPPVGTSCSDGNACNGAELCATGGICSPGTPITTDDSNPCTADSCTPATGVVNHTPLPTGTSCLDGDVCNGNELCDATGTCQPGTSIVLVDDGDPCTLEMCDPILGPVTHQCSEGGQSIAKKADFDGDEWLYTGSNPAQVGVAAGTIVSGQAAIVFGHVQDAQGNALHSVNVTVLNHPEFGSTRTQADGSLEMVVNGGSPLTFEFTRFGFLPVQRVVDVPGNSYANASVVEMIEPDAAVTTIALDQSIEGFQIATGSVLVDENGERQATLLFPSSASATLHLPDGTLESISTLSIRLTEYTGVDALPAEMAAGSIASYAFEANADEARNRGASLEFSEPLTFYVDNFLGFPVGTALPLVNYDRELLEWTSEDSGTIIEILSVTGGLADVDSDGNGTADSPALLAALGFSDEELAALAELYPVGHSVLRTQLTHFSSLACTSAAP